MSCDRNIVTFKWMLDGYTDAAARFDAAEKTRDPQGTYMALFETLNWAVALDERAGTHWLPDGKPLGWKWRQRLGHGAEIMGGVRFARNSVHHQGRMRYSSPAAGCTPNVSLSTVSGGRG